MSATASTSPRKQNADVVIVGCGAGGGVVAKVLGEAGLSVVVLDAGPRFNPETDYSTDRTDFELTGSKVFQPANPARDRYTTDGPFSYTRVKGVGGSTLAYHAVSPRFHESDFRVRTKDGVADDWPIAYEDLEPYYTAVEYDLGVSGGSGAEGNPFDPRRSRPYPTPPHELNAAARIVKRATDKLGLHLIPAPLAIPTQGWDGRPKCLSAGTCGFGCRISAKSSIDVTYVRKAEATTRVDIRSECIARQITIGPTGNARSVLYFDRTGAEHEVEARAIVVAGNAIETPRLLLMSTSSRFPQGLANSSGLVGKYLTEHLGVFAWGRFDERVEAWRGAPVSAMLQDFYATNPQNAFARGWMIQVESSDLWPLSVAQLTQGWGAPHKTRTKQLFAHLVGLATVGEQLPDIRNSVILDAQVKDHLGLPVPRIVHEPRQNDRAMVKAISDSLGQILQAAGALEIIGPTYTPGGSAHYMGTCRMGTDASTSVVDPWCRSHEVRNLFIGDGSVFVTGAAVNPALTISALAMRTAAGIVAAFARDDL